MVTIHLLELVAVHLSSNWHHLVSVAHQYNRGGGGVVPDSHSLLSLVPIHLDAHLCI